MDDVHQIRSTERINDFNNLLAGYYDDPNVVVVWSDDIPEEFINEGSVLLELGVFGVPTEGQHSLDDARFLCS
jgi:hypothetical protein